MGYAKERVGIAKRTCMGLSTSQEYDILKTSENPFEVNEARDVLVSNLDSMILEKLEEVGKVNLSSAEAASVDLKKIFESGSIKYAKGNTMRTFIRAVERQVERRLPELYKTYHPMHLIR